MKHFIQRRFFPTAAKAAAGAVAAAGNSEKEAAS